MEYWELLGFFFACTIFLLLNASDWNFVIGLGALGVMFFYFVFLLDTLVTWAFDISCVLVHAVMVILDSLISFALLFVNYLALSIKGVFGSTPLVISA